MFKLYCAACHGADAKGNGPATPGLKTPPPDLTTLAKRHDGKFPDAYVINVLKHGAAPIHGTADMPVWGPLFGSLAPSNGQDSQEVKLRISNLTRYLESLQVKWTDCRTNSDAAVATPEGGLCCVEVPAANRQERQERETRVSRKV